MAALVVLAACLLVVEKLNINKGLSKAEAEEYIKATMERCAAEDYGSNCLKNAARDFYGKFPLENILSIFDKHEKDSAFFENCHETAHYLGREAYKRVKDIPQIYAEATRTCLGGVLHGAVEGYLIEKKIKLNDFKAIAEELPVICGQPDQYKVKQKYTECHHGLGHAVMFFTDNDLINGLSLCDELEKDSQRELCYTGALMANFDSIGSKDHPSKYYDENNPMYPCNILDERYSRQCYTYGVLVLHQYEVENAISICDRVPEKHRLGCFATFGRDRIMITSDPAVIKDQCSKIKSREMQKECFKGAAHNLVIRFGSKSSLAPQLCSLLEGDIREACFSKVRSALENVEN